MNRKIIQGISITMFLTRIISFVAYRSGYLGGMKSTYSASPNGSVINNPIDTIPQHDSLKIIKSTPEPMIMPSSKVMIIKDPLILKNDSNIMKLDSSLKLDPLMFSTKSGIILKPEDLKQLKKDSSVIDTLKKQ